MEAIAPYWKAVVGYFAPAVMTVGYALLDVSDAGSHVTGSELGLAILATVGTGTGVYMIPNRDPQATHQQESTQPPDAGRRKHRAARARRDIV